MDIVLVSLRHLWRWHMADGRWGDMWEWNDGVWTFFHDE